MRAVQFANRTFDRRENPCFAGSDDRFGRSAIKKLCLRAHFRLHRARQAQAHPPQKANPFAAPTRGGDARCLRVHADMLEDLAHLYPIGDE